MEMQRVVEYALAQRAAAKAAAEARPAKKAAR
jgi:hypothetical protein